MQHTNKTNTTKHKILSENITKLASIMLKTML